MLPTTPEDEARLIQATAAKASRILSMAEAPLGVVGEVTEMGVAETRPDYQISELLLGLHYRSDFDVLSITEAVTPEMVITMRGSDPATFPAANLPAVVQAIDAARSWVAVRVVGFGAA